MVALGRYPVTLSLLARRWHAASGLNIVAFSSGDGDGFCASYWGVDADDRPLCLVTDMQMLDANE